MRTPVLLDLGLSWLQYDLTGTNYEGKDPISKEGHILRFQQTCILGDTVQASTDAEIGNPFPALIPYPAGVYSVSGILLSLL